MKPRFDEERSKWLQCLTGNDRNSVRVQLQAMTWDLASFTIIGEAINLAPKTPKGSPQVSPLVYNLLQVGFYANLLISLRRLTDDGRGVVSLTRVLMDMKKKTSCFTRAAILAAEGMPYEYEPIRRREQDLLNYAMTEGETVYGLGWEHISDRHETIDRLTSVIAEERTPDDHVSKRVFTNLLGKVESCTKQVKKYAGSFVAHAAEKTSAHRIDAEQINLTHGELIKCHRTLCEVFNFTRCRLLGDGSGPMLAFPTYDHFAFIDRPLVAASDVSKLRAKWGVLQEESFKISGWGIAGYEEEFEEKSPPPPSPGVTLTG